MFGKKNIASVAAEFLGSAILTLVVIGVQHSTIGVPYFVGLAAALAMGMLYMALSDASMAMLNPAITIALWSASKVRTVRAIVYIAAQILGAWLAYKLFTYYIHTGLTPVASGFSGRILAAEAVGTAVLAFAWAAAMYRRFTTANQAAVIAVGYALGVILASAATIGLINPAVALADRAWIWGTYVLGPVLGAIIGYNLYMLLFTDEVSRAARSLRVNGRSNTAAPAAVASKPVSRSKTARKTTAKRKTTKRK